MFIGAQVSLYPMTSNFVDVITSGLGALTPYLGELRIETDDMSTLLVGAPDPLIDAIRDLFAAAARAPDHVAMHVVLSRGCPGEPDDPICRCDTLAAGAEPVAGRAPGAGARRGRGGAGAGVDIDVQFSLYVLGQDRHMDEIYGCIDFLKGSGTFLKSKNFCTRLRGDAGAVFETRAPGFPALRSRRGPRGDRSHGVGQQPEPRLILPVPARPAKPLLDPGRHAPASTAPAHGPARAGVSAGLAGLLRDRRRLAVGVARADATCFVR